MIEGAGRSALSTATDTARTSVYPRIELVFLSASEFGVLRKCKNLVRTFESLPC
jgi:hypothetical protein